MKVNGDALALNVIREVAIGGSFLDHEHTLMNFRSELFEPKILFRERREQWNTSGAKTLTQRAEEVADDLIANVARRRGAAVDHPGRGTERFEVHATRTIL